jgi:hypothetical protein
VRKPLLNKKARITKNYKKGNLQKQKQKKLLSQSQCPMKTPASPSRHDATEEKKVMVQFCYRGEKEMKLLTLYYRQLPRKQVKRRQTKGDRKILWLSPRKSEDQPELFSDF